MKPKIDTLLTNPDYELVKKTHTEYGCWPGDCGWTTEYEFRHVKTGKIVKESWGCHTIG